MTALEALSAATRAALMAGDPVRLPGLGTLEKVHVPARLALRPGGGRVLLPPSAAVRFRPSGEAGPAEPALIALFARFAAPAGDPARAFADAVDQLLARLAARGEAELGGVGLFRRDDRSTGFVPAGVLLAALNRAYIGLAPVATPGAPPEPVGSETPGGADEPPPRAPSAPPSDQPPGGPIPAASPTPDDHPEDNPAPGGPTAQPGSAGEMAMPFDPRAIAFKAEDEAPEDPAGRAAEAPAQALFLENSDDVDGSEAAPRAWTDDAVDSAEADDGPPGDAEVLPSSDAGSPAGHAQTAGPEHAADLPSADALSGSEPDTPQTGPRPGAVHSAGPLRDAPSEAYADQDDLLDEDFTIAPPLLDWDEPAPVPKWAARAAPSADDDAPHDAPEADGNTAGKAAEAPETGVPSHAPASSNDALGAFPEEPAAEDTEALYAWMSDDLGWPNEHETPGADLPGADLSDRPPSHAGGPASAGQSTEERSLLPDDVEAWLAGAWVPPHAEAVSNDLGPPPEPEDAEFRYVGSTADAAASAPPPPDASADASLPSEPVDRDPSGFAPPASAPPASAPPASAPPASARPRRRTPAYALAGAGALALVALLLLPRLIAPRETTPVPPREAAPEAALTAPPDFRPDEDAPPSDAPAGASETDLAPPPDDVPPAPPPRPALDPPARAPVQAPAPAVDAAVALLGPAPIDPAQGGFTWVTDSTPIRADAERAAARHRQAGFRAAVLPGTASQRTVYRVAIGQFATREAAIAARDRLPADVRQDAWTLNLSP
ncbi:MAG: SPOR domain-containing protein [Rubricoccaceae bacterium]